MSIEIYAGEQILEKEEKRYLDLRNLQRSFKEIFIKRSAEAERLSDLLETFLFSFSEFRVASFNLGSCGGNLFIQISQLECEFRASRDRKVLVKIKRIIHEVYRRIAKYTSKQRFTLKRVLRKIRALITRDIRAGYRKMIKVHFKNLSDQSGADDNETFDRGSIYCKSLNCYQNALLYKTKYCSPFEKGSSV